MHAVLANIAGPDILIVVAVVLVLFGGTQLPKLARSLGSASHEFRKGVEEGHTEGADTKGHTEGAETNGKASLKDTAKETVHEIKDAATSVKDAATEQRRS